MTIKIKPAMRAPINEFTPTVTQRMPIDFVRIMIPYLHLARNNAHVNIWAGTIWERIDDQAKVLNYPGVEFDIYVEGADCTIVMDGIYGPGLFSQWTLEQISMPMVTQIPKTSPGPMRSCS